MYVVGGHDMLTHKFGCLNTHASHWWVAETSPGQATANLQISKCFYFSVHFPPMFAFL